MYQSCLLDGLLAEEPATSQIGIRAQIAAGMPEVAARPDASSWKATMSPGAKTRESNHPAWEVEKGGLVELFVDVGCRVKSFEDHNMGAR